MNAMYETTTEGAKRSRHGQLTRMEMLNRLEAAQARTEFWLRRAEKLERIRLPLVIGGLFMGVVLGVSLGYVSA
jgi:hypothetical protein